MLDVESVGEKQSCERKQGKNALTQEVTENSSILSQIYFRDTLQTLFQTTTIEQILQ